MSRRLFALISILAITGLILPAGGIGLAQVPGSTGGRVQPSGRRPALTGDVQTPLVQRHAPAGAVNVVVELTDAPAVEAFAESQAADVSAQATAAAQAQLARIEQAQQSLLAPLAQLGATVIYRTQRVYNGIAVRVDAGQLSNIAQLPGVKAVHPLATHELDLTSSVPLIGAPELWNAGGLGLTGQGISVGVIDTGLDYLHADFGGAGAITPTLYTDNDTTVTGDVPGFPSVKVVGGYDFVGDDYDADGTGAQLIPQPDPDPMDCNGHGSHVAGITGGYGVEQDGSTYTGPYSSTLNFTGTFQVGPGVAPEVELYALRVFGCDGSTNVVDEALEWAVDPNGDGDFSDHLDVVNMSLGSTFGSTNDTSAVASNNAVLAGVIVVAAAGNAGDTYYVVDSPSVADRVISVASSVDASNVLDGFRVNPPSAIAGVYAAAESVAFDWADSFPVTGTLVYPQIGPNPALNQRTGCYTFNITNTNIISGNIVLLDWSEPSCGGSVLRTANARAAGAKGVLIADESDTFDLFITGDAFIPTMSTPKQVGASLKANLPLSVTLSHEYHSTVDYSVPADTDTLSSFSSRGPRRSGSALKPDLAAPGDTVFSAGALTGDEGANISGTSMATPHVAGALALLRELHPTWTVEELKALAMNTAGAPIRSSVPLTSTLYGPNRAGPGRIVLPNAAASGVVAYNPGTPGAVSISFGAPEVLTTTVLGRKVRVLNKTNVAVTYTVAYSAVLSTPGVTFTHASSAVVPPFGLADIPVTLTVNAAQLRKTIDPTVSPTQGGDARHWVAEAGGAIRLTPTGGGQTQVLRVPVYASPRPVSNMAALSSTLTFNATPVISLTGQGVNTSGTPFDLPPDVTSLVTALELQYTSPDEASTSGVANNADLKYVGATSDFEATGDITDTLIYFGIATQGNWTTLNEVEFDVYIDTDRDGTDDFVLLNAIAGVGGDPTDLFYSWLFDLNGGLVNLYYVNDWPADLLDTQAYNTNVIVFPVAAADLGLTGANSTFNYHIQSFSADASGAPGSSYTENFSGIADTTGVLTYNAGNPGLDFSGGIPGIPIWADLNGEVIEVGYDLAAYVAAHSQGVLLLHHHNAAGKHAEVVSISAKTIFLPLIYK